MIGGEMYIASAVQLGVISRVVMEISIEEIIRGPCTILIHLTESTTATILTTYIHPIRITTADDRYSLDLDVNRWLVRADADDHHAEDGHDRNDRTHHGCCCNESHTTMSYHIYKQWETKRMMS